MISDLMGIYLESSLQHMPVLHRCTKGEKLSIVRDE